MEITTAELTTTDQMHRLQACGIDDPHWCNYTLTYLMNLMPQHISIVQNYQYEPFVDGYEISELEYPYKVSGYFTIRHCNGWWCANYFDDAGITLLGKIPSAKTIIEAIVKLVELLYANGYDFKKNNYK